MNAEKILENCQHPIEGVVDMSTGHTIVCVACASTAIEAARVEERAKIVGVLNQYAGSPAADWSVLVHIRAIADAIKARGGK